MIKSLNWILAVAGLWMVPQLALGLNRQTFLNENFDRSQNGIKVAFFDADSTLRVSQSGSFSASGPQDYQILPCVSHSLQVLQKKGYLIAIVSNQGAVPERLPYESADGAIFNMIQDLKAQGAIVHYYDYAEHEDEHRKPEPGMGLRLENYIKAKFGSQFYIDKQQSFMVGDSAYKRPENGHPGDIRPDGRPGFNFSNADRFFAQNFGVSFVEPQFFFGWKQMGTELIERKSEADALAERIQATSRCERLIQKL